MDHARGQGGCRGDEGGRIPAAGSEKEATREFGGILREITIGLSGFASRSLTQISAIPIDCEVGTSGVVPLRYRRGSVNYCGRLEFAGEVEQIVRGHIELRA